MMLALNQLRALSANVIYKNNKFDEIKNNVANKRKLEKGMK